MCGRTCHFSGDEITDVRRRTDGGTWIAFYFFQNDFKSPSDLFRSVLADALVARARERFFVCGANPSLSLEMSFHQFTNDMGERKFHLLRNSRPLQYYGFIRLSRMDLQRKLLFRS
jgi:hypothetical protein